LRSAAGDLRGFWLAYEFDRVAGPLRLPVVWARGLPVVEPELRCEPSVLKGFIEKLLAVTKSSRRLAVMVTTEPAAGGGTEATLSGLGFGRQDLSSVVLDLAPPEEELWSAIAKGTRYSMKKAEKAGCVIHESSDPRDSETLAEMVGHTLELGGVSYRLPIEEFQGYRELAAGGGGRLTVATIDGEIAGAIFEVLLGDRSLTHLWTTNELGRKHRVGDLMVWEAMRRCKADGLRWLDLGTIKTQPEEGSKAAGIHAFKTKWGGTITPTPFYRRPGPLDRAIQTLRRMRGGF
jgi:hypothetical protein